MIRLSVAALFLTFSAFAQTIPTYETVVLSQGNVKFPLQPADKEPYEPYCPLNVCTCESDISYIQLHAPTNSAAAALINRKLKTDASQVKCSYLDAEASMKQEITNLSAGFVSVVERFYQQQIATGGSCHAGSAVHTFDFASGKEYLLSDIIAKSSLASLRSTMPASIVKEHNRQEDQQLYEEEEANAPGYRHTTYVESPEDFTRDLKSARKGVANVSDAQLLGSAILIQKGRVFINIEDYLFGCVGGTFHPAEIPASLVTLPAIRQELGSR